MYINASNSSMDHILKHIILYLLDRTNKKASLELIRSYLDNDSSRINEMRFGGNAYLHVACVNAKCTGDLVRLLCDYGADVTLHNMINLTPIELAMRVRCNESVLLALEERGGINSLEPYEASFFCCSIFLKCQLHIINFFMKRIKSLDLCQMSEHNGSLFRCATRNPHPAGTIKILQMLFENGFKIEKNSNLMCYVLKRGHDMETIEFLKENGVSFECSVHKSFWSCLGGPASTILTVDFAKFLLKYNMAENGYNLGMTPLQYILRKCRYEFEAIKLLLDAVKLVSPSTDAGKDTGSVLDSVDNAGPIDAVKNTDLKTYFDWADNSLLHLAVANTDCLFSVLELLIERGISVNLVNKFGKTAVDEVLLSRYVDIEILILFLKNGAKLNPCSVTSALSQSYNIDLFKLLLSTGVRLDKEGYFKIILGIVNRGCSYKLVSCFDYVLKCLFLEIPNCEPPILSQKYMQYVCQYRKMCVKEVTRLRFKKVGPYRTLWHLLSPKGTLRGTAGKAEDKMFDFGLLLGRIDNASYPLYLPVISDKIGRSLMLKKLQEVPVYTLDYVLEPSEQGKKWLKWVFITLNNDCLLRVARYLDEVDLLNLLVVYFNAKQANAFQVRRYKQEQIEAKVLKQQSLERKRRKIIV